MFPSSTVHKCHSARKSLHIVPIYGLLSQSAAPAVMLMLSLPQLIDREVQPCWEMFDEFEMLVLLMFNDNLLS